jgi:hypothetical protein
MVDLSGEDGYGERLSQLFGKFLELQVQMDDTLDMRDYFPAMFKN